MLPRPLPLKTSLALAAATGAMLMACACAPTMTHHGYLAQDARPSTDIKVGDTQETVIDKLGAPSQTSVYDKQEWYYIDQVSMKMTYKQPHVTARSVTIVDFNAADNTVAKVQTLSLADGRALTPNQNKTPTRGRSLTALEQVLGTVGRQRINNDQDTNPGNTNHRRE